MDIVDEYKYLGVIVIKLDWTKNTDSLYKKGQSCRYFLRMLRSFKVCRTLLQLLWQASSFML